MTRKKSEPSTPVLVYIGIMLHKIYAINEKNSYDYVSDIDSNGNGIAPASQYECRELFPTI